MKYHFIPLLAGLALFTLLGTVGCGTTTETTKSTTRATTPSSTTTVTTPATSSSTAASSSSEITLPDLNNPITDVEPNIPESGVGDMTESGMNDIVSDMMPGARGGRGDANRTDPALPTK